MAATFDLSSGGAAALSREAVNAGYCSALRTYAVCTKRMARPCRGDLAYHSAVQGIEDLLIQHRCPRVGPTAQPRPQPQGTLSGDTCLYEKSFFSREGRTPEYLHCSVFGDLHIRTFNDDFHTCAVQGAWPLIDNEHLYVQATTSPARGGSHPTVLTKVSQSSAQVFECIVTSSCSQTFPPDLTDVSLKTREQSPTFLTYQSRVTSAVGARPERAGCILQ